MRRRLLHHIMDLITERDYQEAANEGTGAERDRAGSELAKGVRGPLELLPQYNPLCYLVRMCWNRRWLSEPPTTYLAHGRGA